MPTAKLQNHPRWQAHEPLYGREKEIQQLQSCWKRCCRNAHQELVVWRGKPGVGKAALAHSLERHLELEQPKPSGIFVSGTFTENACNEPYEIFVTTMQQYVEQLFGLLNAPELVACGRAVQQAIGKDEELVTRVFPSVKRLLGQPSQRKVIFSGPNVEERIGMATLYRFHLVFAKLFAALTEYMPMAIFLNNVQWADTESLSILRLLMRSEPMAITIICGYQFFKTSLEGKSRGSDTLTKSEHVQDDDLTEPPTIPIYFE